MYLPRRLAGGTDIDVLRRLRDEHIPVLLYGPPGTGKTALVEAAHPDLLTVAGTGTPRWRTSSAATCPNPTAPTSSSTARSSSRCAKAGRCSSTTPP